MENFLTVNQLDKQMELIQLRMLKDQENLFVGEVKKVLTWFRDKFPKRHLQWMDGMGTGFWVLDDEIWNVETYIHAPVYNQNGGYDGDSKYLTEREWTKKEILLKPLVDFYNAISDTTNSHQSGTYIGVWEIDRVSREIVEVVV